MLRLSRLTIVSILALTSSCLFLDSPTRAKVVEEDVVEVVQADVEAVAVVQEVEEVVAVLQVAEEEADQYSDVAAVEVEAEVASEEEDEVEGVKQSLFPAS